jgi:hypothetical protein
MENVVQLSYRHAIYTMPPDLNAFLSRHQTDAMRKRNTFLMSRKNVHFPCFLILFLSSNVSLHEYPSVY